MPRPTLTVQQRQLQQQRRMQQEQRAPDGERSRDIPAKQDQAPRPPSPAMQQNGNADQ